MKMGVKKNIFIFISLILIFLVFEFIFYQYFKFNDKDNLKNYILKREGSNGYFFSDKLKLVLPKQNNQVLFVTNEYVDKARAKDIFKKGFGVFDDGNKYNRKYQMVALGDSFTFGQGSTDPINKNIYSLIENRDKSFNIINLGYFGKSINDQKYVYDKFKFFSKHDFLIYNFFSHDYKDNLSDFSSSYYIEKITKDFSKLERKILIDKLNKIHGFKYHLEYLMNTKIRSYNLYFVLKFYDLILINLAKKNIISFFYGDKFFKKYPRELGRIGVLNEKTYNLKKLFRETIYSCKQNYCFEHQKILEIKDIKNKVIKNSANLINKFYLETSKDKKKFILVIHPAPRNLFSKETTIVDYNEMDDKLINSLNKNIVVIDLRKYLVNYQKQNLDEIIFWKKDGHYTPKGYQISSDFVYKSLLNELE